MNSDLFDPPIKISKSDLEFLRKIGGGAFSTVWRVKYTPTSSLYALKIVQKSKVATILPQFRREVSILYEVEHPNIIRLFTHFEDFSCFYLLMELLEGGSLFHKLPKDKPLSEKLACSYFSQIASAVEYLHSCAPPIIHRDIKPENILLTKQGQVKLIDFGWANYLAENRNTTCGTLEYLSPEIVEEKSHDLSVDIWCLGVLLYEMLCGCTPFKATVKEMIFYNIRKGTIRFPATVSCLAKDLILKMLERTTENRISIVDVQKHEWVKSGGSDEILAFSACYENTVAGNGTDMGESKSTKESYCAEDAGKKVEIKEDAESLKDRLSVIKDRILGLEMEKHRLISAERNLKQCVYEAGLEIDNLQSTDTTLAISDSLHHMRKLNFDKMQICKKQRLYLEQLKIKVDSVEKELSDKESQLKTLTDSSKTLLLNISRIKSYKSLDLSTLKLNLDVIQSQLGDSFVQGEITIKEIMDYVTNSVKDLQNVQIRDFERKIDEKKEAVAELQQKIAELTINFEDSKGKILQSSRRVKEELFKVSKKCREEHWKNQSRRIENDKQAIFRLLSPSKEEIDSEVTEEIVDRKRFEKDVRIR
jgi:aurora kinase, other